MRSPIRLIRLLALLIVPTVSGASDPLAPLAGVVQATAGNAHTCALGDDGRVRCWGSNEHGELGLGDARPTSRTTPVAVVGLDPGIRAVAAGYYHSCAITAERRVKCWGWNPFGQLGNGSVDFESVTTPVDVQGLADVLALTGGAVHTCALTQAGAVLCWGYNEHGQLGDGSTQNRDAPVAVNGLGGAAVAIDAGADHTCAVLASGSVQCWGNNVDGQLGDGSRDSRSSPVLVQGLGSAATRISTAARSTCAIVGGGAVRCWGDLILENDSSDGGSTVARPVPRLEAGFIALDAGVFHHCFLPADGAVRCLGTNSLGQFGNGSLNDSFAAEATIGLAAPAAVAIAAGGDHTCAVLRNGGLQCWGRNNNGQLGIDVTSERLVPTPVAGLGSGVQTIAAGSVHGCTLSSTGVVKCWGANNYDQLGDGTGVPKLIAIEVAGLGAGVRTLDAGFAHNCAITAERRAKCWGANFDGTLGNDGALVDGGPVDVLGLDGDVIALAQGRSHGCALLQGGAVRCWGRNEFGQLGNNSSADSFVAVPVSGLASGVSHLSAGMYHTCAITAAGGMQCWGANTHGQLGDGSTVLRRAPVAVSGLSAGVIGIGAGVMHSCAILQGGAVSCWGANDFGTLLGDGSTMDRAVPGIVPALRSGVVEISLSGSHSCVRLASGGMRCWGSNFNGALGDNSGNHRPQPADVAGLTAGVGAIDLGLGGQSCAVVDGAARCWGENTFGQLGDGTSFGQPLPQTVLSNELQRRIDAVSLDANADSQAAVLDATGRYLVFQSAADNLVAGDSNGALDVFRADRETNQIERISLDNAGQQLSGDARLPAVSMDGQRVLFVAADTAVAKVLGESSTQSDRRSKTHTPAVFLRNMLTGTTQRIGATSADASSPPQIAAGGGAVVFVAQPSTAAEGAAGQDNIYRVALTTVGQTVQIGAAECLSCKSADASGALTASNVDGASAQPVLSADGRTVVWQTTAKNALSSGAPCPTATLQIVMRDLVTGSTRQISPPAGTAASACGSQGSQRPSIDYSGTRIAFETDQALQPNDHNARQDVYLWQADVGAKRISEGSDGSDPIGDSTTAKLSGDGKHLSFVSTAPNLDTTFADNNDAGDVHTVALDDGRIARLSRSASGGEAEQSSDRPSISFDGSQIAFDSVASLLAGQAGRSTVYARSNPLAPPKRSATWWIAAESGWGLTVFDQGSVLLPAWFTYDTDGEPTWFIAGGAFPQADGSYRGDLLRFTGIPFDHPQGGQVVQAVAVGDVALRFAGEDQLRFDYRVDALSQSKLLRRFPFGARSFSCAAAPSLDRRNAVNYTDMWTGSEEGAAWGLSMFHVDDLLVAIWYTYDTDGEAVFFVVTTTRQPDGSFTGDVSRQRNGTPFSAIDGEQPSPGNDLIGSATLRFIDGERASFSHRIGDIDHTRAINRLQVGDQATVCRSENVAP